MCKEQLEKNKEVVRNLFKAIDANDKEAFIACEHPDFKLVFPGFDVLDREGHWNMAGSERIAFPDMKHNPEFQLAEGDWVVTKGHITGTNLGPYHGKEPTGNSINIYFINYCRFKDGLIIDINSVFDRMAEHEQLYGKIQ